MKKRVLSIFLAALTALAVLPVYAADGQADGDWLNSIYDYKGCWIFRVIKSEEEAEQYEIVRYVSNHPETHLVFPSSFYGVPVTSIKGGLGLTGIVLGNDLGLGGAYIIPSSYGVEEVTLPDSITFSNGYSFCCCSSLKKITLSKNLTEISTFDFYGCTSLESINIPASVTTIGRQAFSDCESLEQINIPAAVTDIWHKAFEGCTSLGTVYYGGTREQWNNIAVRPDNGPLTSATIYYNHPAHTMEYVPSAATCTEAGEAAHYHCTLCGKDFLDEAGETEFYGQTEPALGHVAGDWKVTTEATCTEAGTAKQYCARCDYVFSAIRIIASDHEPGDWVVTAAPNCTEAGVETRVCAKCGACLSDTREIAALGHEYQPVSTTAPTCTENGFTTLVCRRCGDTCYSNGDSAPGHLFGEWTLTGAPDCTASGEETRYCSRCGAVETRTVDPLGHNFGKWIETSAPGCVDEGEETRYCSDCEAFETRPIEATGHSYSNREVVTEETCTTDGEERYVCSVCGSVETLVRPATGHSFVYGYCRTCWAEDPSTAKIGVSTAIAGRGRTVELTVSMTQNPGVSSLIIGLDYDPDALTLESVTNGDLFDETADFDPEDGNGTVTFDSASNVTGDGVLMTLTFTVTDEASPGWNDDGAFVRFACDENGDDVDVLWFGSSVFVFAYGDANYDGTVDVTDVILISQYILDNTIPIGYGADANGDGAVDVMDVILISQYILDPSVVLGP